MRDVLLHREYIFIYPAVSTLHYVAFIVYIVWITLKYTISFGSHLGDLGKAKTCGQGQSDSKPAGARKWRFWARIDMTRLLRRGKTKAGYGGFV